MSLGSFSLSLSFIYSLLSCLAFEIQLVLLQVTAQRQWVPWLFFFLFISISSFLLRPNIKVIRSLLPVYICTPTNSFRNNFIITDRCIKFASICYWMMMASAHHTNRHITDLCALYYIITQSKDRAKDIERERESATKMKLPHLFDTYCDEEEKKSNGREKKYKLFFSFYFFIIEASKEKFELVSFD